jgi:RNA-directed DNA polymerase
VREIRPLRLTWRELETWSWWNCEPTTQSKESGWKPSTCRARARSRPYLRARGAEMPRATHLVLGFQHRSDAERFWKELAERLQKFRLELHPDKTRLLEFGPFAAENRKRRGQEKPETFNFLGFTHICGKKRSTNGMFTVLRQTIRARLQAKLSEVKAELKRRMHAPIPEQGRWLGAVVGGHIRYYGVPMNGAALFLFRSRVGWLWHRALSRRSQNGRVLWHRMYRLIDRWLPPPRICHPYPLRRLGVIT